MTALERAREEAARNAAKAIWSDLTDRSGFPDDFDAETMDEIMCAIAKPIEQALLSRDAEVARLRELVKEAHVALGASGGITEIECSCEVCKS